jgi:signal transduction histidine kinase/CheY-like chemotaxis protein
MYLTVLAILGTVIQSKVSPLWIMALTLVYLVGWTVADSLFPRLDTLDYLHNFPPFFMAIAIALCLVGVSYGQRTLIKTEKDLSREIELRYTELYEAQAHLLREESANQAKNTFLANLSHELRTPLSAVLGYAHLLQDPGISIKEKLRFSRSIEANGRQLARLVDDLLDLSKMQTGTIDIEKVDCNLAELIAEVIHLLEIRAKKKNLPIQVKFTSPIPETIPIDPLRFQQILNNLVSNAIKFTERGQIEINVSFSSPNSELLLSVHDTGRGISPDEAKDLFKAFSQAEAGMSRRYGGIGLGLNFSRKIALLLGGHLDLTWSAIGQGSEFTLRLPVEIPSGTHFLSAYLDPLNHPPVPPEGGHFDFSDLKILVVDDAPENRDILKHFLVPTGAHVDMAVDGKDCLDKVALDHYNMVLMDIQMPGLDGLKATHILRQRSFDAPIIAVTAHALKEDKQRCFEAGCNAHIAKPLKKQELMETIWKYSHAPARMPTI